MKPKGIAVSKISLEDRIYLRISGEIGKFNTIPWETLKKVGDSLQDLIIAIAKTDIDNSEAIDLDNFKIEMNGFFPGSAVPAFKLTPRIQAVIGDVQEQRSAVNEKFVRLMKLANEGNYLHLNKQYRSGVSRNLIAEKLYRFTTSTGNSPMDIVIPTGDKFRGVYNIKKFSREARNKLIDNVISIETEIEIQPIGTAIARVELTKKGIKTTRKIRELYTNKSNVPSYSPNILSYDTREYILFSPLSSAIIKDGDTYLVENKMLGIVGAGKDEADAEADFAKEFDFIYQRYQSLKENEMSGRIKRIKVLLNNIVKQVNQL